MLPGLSGLLVVAFKQHIRTRNHANAHACKRGNHEPIVTATDGRKSTWKNSGMPWDHPPVDPHVQGASSSICPCLTKRIIGPTDRIFVCSGHQHRSVASLRTEARLARGATAPPQSPLPCAPMHRTIHAASSRQACGRARDRGGRTTFAPGESRRCRATCHGRTGLYLSPVQARCLHPMSYRPDNAATTPTAAPPAASSPPSAGFHTHTDRLVRRPFAGGLPHEHRKPVFSVRKAVQIQRHLLEAVQIHLPGTEGSLCYQV